MWERIYLLGGITGWENTETHDIIYPVYRHQWDVMLQSDDKVETIKNFKSLNEANDFIDQYISNRGKNATRRF
jgi:hypothetical protein